MQSANMYSDDFQTARWYALFLECNQEKRVALHLAARDIEHFLPCYESLRQWKDRRVKLQRPLFPGYVFVRIALVERTRAVTIPHVVAFVGPKALPSVISDEEIAGIRRALEYRRIEPHPYLKVGQRVAITRGLLSGMQGILVRQSNGARVVVSLETITCAFAVEVDLDSLDCGDAANVLDWYGMSPKTLAAKHPAATSPPPA